MENPRPEKVAVVDEVRERLDSTSATLLTEYRGLDVSAISELRRALRAAGGFAGTLSSVGRAGRPVVILGRDPRLSSPALAAAVTSGLLQSGCDVVDLGIVPTPVVPLTLLSVALIAGSVAFSVFAGPAR